MSEQDKYTIKLDFFSAELDPHLRNFESGSFWATAVVLNLFSNGLLMPFQTRDSNDQSPEAPINSTNYERIVVLKNGEMEESLTKILAQALQKAFEGENSVIA